MFRFESPQILQFLWLVPIVLVIALFLFRRSQKRLQKVLGTRLYPFLTDSLSLSRRRLKLILESLALVCFVTALARPQLGESMQEIKSRGIELMIAVDVSNSMLTEDVKPSRLEHLKKELYRLLDRLSGDKVGIVIFAGSAATLTPMTSDYSALKMFIDSLSTDSISTQGTSFSKAIQECLDAFKNGGVTDDNSTRMTRVLLIASDGEDHEPGALALAKKALEKGVRTFTFGFGTEKGGAIPIRDQWGNLKGFKKDNKGNVILSTAKSEALRALAAAGGGAFYHATPGGNAVESLRADIDKLQKAEFESKLAANYDEQFQLALIIGLVFAFIELFFGERKSGKRIWKGRFEVSEE